MVAKEDVKQFLKEFKEKMKIWSVLYRDDRGKNTSALSELEITPNDRKKHLEKLEADDYSDGPLEEKLYGGSNMWVFGITVKKKEVYVKITLGNQGSSVICISFHIAEYEMSYPFKNK